VDDTVTVREFERLAERLGIRVRYTSGGPSGICTVKGERELFIDRELGPSERVALFVREFRGIDLEGVFVVPLIRKLLKRGEEDLSWE